MDLIECIISDTKKSVPFSNCITKPEYQAGTLICQLHVKNLYFGMVY